MARKGDRQIEFHPLSRGDRQLQNIFRAIARKDAGQFKRIGVLVVPTNAELRRVRDSKFADKYPRAFFASEEELRDGVAPVSALPANVMAFDADVLANQQIGGPGSPFWILRFKAPEIEDVTPAQFVMMDVTPARPLLSGRVVRRRGWDEDMDRPPLPILKRPFGIQRAYYRHFDKLYLQKLVLPPALAPALHMVYPHEFELLYKVLPDGVGTALMTKLKRGDTVQMVGPLGRPHDVRSLRAQGIEEVHVIGGGVGTAPLILLVHALRYYSFRVKVFIGISKLDVLRYSGDVAASFAEEPGNAYVYVDDLLEAGLRPADIHLAFDTELPKRSVRGIPKPNLFAGFVPTQYQEFLKKQKPQFVMAYTCGPDKMMELVWGIAREAGIPLRVLMEKRMGCGFGVCLSCVCKVRGADGEETYARVCTEGPVFDAGDILWKENNSKSPLVNCGSARPC